MCISTFSHTKTSKMESSGLQKIIKTQINFLDCNKTLHPHPTTYCWQAVANNCAKSKINTHILNHKTIYDKCSLIIILNGARSPLVLGPPHCFGFQITHKHTPRRTPLNKGSAQQTQTTNIHIPSGIRARDPSKREMTDPRLRPHGHRDLLFPRYTYQNWKSTQPFT